MMCWMPSHGKPCAHALDVMWDTSCLSADAHIMLSVPHY